MEDSTLTIADRLAEVRRQIAAACERANRIPESVTLIAVSKTHSSAAILEAVADGQTHFGENRIEEAAEKIPVVMSSAGIPLTWHMIGHVQSRKARDVITHFDLIHSLDSVKLAERYSRFAVEIGHKTRVLLEMNVSGEDSKSGFNAVNWEQGGEGWATLLDDIQRLIELPGVQIEGLMTMAPIVDDMEATRPVFRSLRRLRDTLATKFPIVRWDTLSMGMTDDYQVAIEEGATLVRIGRAIFGERT